MNEIHIFSSQCLNQLFGGECGGLFPISRPKRPKTALP
jgi:hypothetical protein